MKCPGCNDAMVAGHVLIDANRVVNYYRQFNPVVQQDLQLKVENGAWEIVLFNNLKLSAYRCFQCSSVVLTDEHCSERD